LQKNIATDATICNSIFQKHLIIRFLQILEV
jgi:hypothetical protein